MTIFLFTDAGFGSLKDGESTKSGLIILGKAGRHQEVVECHGWLIANNACKISRVARSSLAAEVMAIADGIDLVQWYRVHWYEILFAEFIPQILHPTDQLPLQTPFNRADEPKMGRKIMPFL